MKRRERVRRSKETILADRERQWNILRDYYCGNYGCSKCGEVTYCRGRRKDALKCKECFLGTV